MSDDTGLDIRGAKPRFASWLSEPMRANRSIYLRVALAAVFINLFALTSSLFTMVVYDRVLPNNAVDSLIALSIGLGLIIVFDFILKMLRAYFTDVAGARIDRDVGGRVFDQLLALRMNERKGSTGALAGLMRELETLRDFFASATITAIVDVPFIVLILAVIAIIGGPVVYVPLAMVPLVIIAGWLTHPAMDRLSAQAMSQGLHKQSVLVETIGGMETVKASGAGHLLTRRWTGAIEEHSDVSLRQRLVANVAITLSQSAQTISYAGVVIVGVGLIAAQELSMGGLIACSILAGRAVAPLAQIASLLSRLSSTRAAYRQIDALMGAGREGNREGLIRSDTMRGELELRNVSFSYPGGGGQALGNVSFRIAPGEHVAIVGRVGSGKSTITRLVLGLYPPEDGSVLVDGLDVRQLEPESLRRRIGSVLQETVLFSGTVRDNIQLGRPEVDDAEMLRAARLSGAHDFMATLANGYDRRLADRGEGLSGGQRQTIGLARALAGSPAMLLLDEPSSQMDTESEAQLLQRMKAEIEGRTMIVVTHRTPFLQLVDRVIVIDKGRLIADGPRDEVLRQMRGKSAGPAKPAIPERSANQRSGFVTVKPSDRLS